MSRDIESWKLEILIKHYGICHNVLSFIGSDWEIQPLSPGGRTLMHAVLESTMQHCISPAIEMTAGGAVNGARATGGA
ncbi:MAG: hypothetical protein ACYDCJ_04045 [Gammaproteobacteria bacterium]